MHSPWLSHSSVVVQRGSSGGGRAGFFDKRPPTVQLDKGLPNLYTLDDELLDAVFLRDTDQVRQLLARGADPDAYNEERCTPLMMATVEGDADIARSLLEAGADPNLLDGDGWTALDVAVYRRSLDLVWLLLQYGAAASTEANTGSKVLVRAMFGEKGSAEILRLLPGWGTVGDLTATLATAAAAARRFGAPLGEPKPKAVN
jgi:ankyrin repeat protein